MNVYVAGALLAIGIALYIVGVRGLLGTSAARRGPRAAAERATMAAWAAGACAAAASLLFAVVPVHVTETSSDAGVIRSEQTLVGSEGYGVLPVLAAPVAITVLAALTRRQLLRTALAAIFDASCVLAMLSIGAFYVPAAIALTIAAVRTPPRRLAVLQHPRGQLPDVEGVSAPEARQLPGGRGATTSRLSQLPHPDDVFGPEPRQLPGGRGAPTR